MASTHRAGSLHVLSCNCRSVKSSMIEVKELCDLSHFVFLLQEHWLLPCNLAVLNSIHADFLGTGHAAVDISHDVLVGSLIHSILVDDLRN